MVVEKGKNCQKAEKRNTTYLQPPVSILSTGVGNRSPRVQLPNQLKDGSSGGHEIQ
jgi:hypothetical protein